MPFVTDDSGMVHGSRNEVTESINEAMVNALVHAWYGAAATVRVVVRPQTVLVTNSGSMLVDRAVAIAGGGSEPRNPTLLKIFTLIGAGDRAGSGLYRIWSVWNHLYSETPCLTERYNPSVVSLELPLHEVEPSELAGGDRQHDLVRREPVDGQAIVSLISSSENGLTSKEVAERFGISERRARERLRSLYAEEQISRVKEGHSYRDRARI